MERGKVMYAMIRTAAQSHIRGIKSIAPGWFDCRGAIIRIRVVCTVLLVMFVVPSICIAVMEPIPYYKVEKKPELISLSEHDYSHTAEELGVEGRTIVKALIDIDGTIVVTKILESSDNKQLDQAAIDAAKRALFSPAMHEGRKVRVWVAIPFSFESAEEKQEQIQESEKVVSEDSKRFEDERSSDSKNESEPQIYRVGEWVTDGDAGLEYRVIRAYKTEFTYFDIWVQQGREGDYVDWYSDYYYVLGVVEIEVKGISSEEVYIDFDSFQITHPTSCWPYDDQDVLDFLNDNEENRHWVTQHTSIVLSIPFLIETNMARHYGNERLVEDIVPDGRVIRVGPGDIGYTQVEIGYFK